jgi:hypothetical protein
MRTLTAHPVRLAAAAVALVALAASPAAASVTSGRDAGSKGSVQTTTFSVTLTSQQTVLEQVGRGGARTYGWNQLTGTASSASGDIGVTLLGNVDYTNGEGPFFGFMTLKFASLSTVGLRIVTGRATKDASGTTNLTANMRVIGGNAALTGAKGTGSFTGTRSAELGAPIQIDVRVKIHGVDIG